METELNIWIKDDTLNKKKISTLLKAKQKLVLSVFIKKHHNV